MQAFQNTVSRIISSVTASSTRTPDTPPKQQQILSSSEPRKSSGSDLNNSEMFELIQSDTPLEKKCPENLLQQSTEWICEPQAEFYMIQNLYFNDVVVEKYQEPRVLQWDEWQLIIRNHNYEGICRRNLIFSILKGIPFQVRKQLWEVLAETDKMKKEFPKTYKEYLHENPNRQLLGIIEKDTPRTLNCPKHQKQLRNILVAYSNLDPSGYCQGMNNIVGSLLTLLDLSNDKVIGDLDFVVEQLGLEERVFWVFVGIMYGKNWRECYIGMVGVQRMIKDLESLMIKHNREVLDQIYKMDMDLNICFAQYYLTLIIYNTPLGLAKRFLDLFLLEGEKVLHSMVMRMLNLCKDKILSMNDPGCLIHFFKIEMLQYCYNQIREQKEKASSLEDFAINFFHVSTSL